MSRKPNLNLKWGKPKTSTVISKGLWKLLAIVTSWSRDEGWAAKIEKLVENY